MDCSWLIEDSCNESEGSESDPEETKAELEARLYSIVHHSDLSKPLPPDLAKHYSVQCEDDGKLTVALNDSLENVKSEEVKKVDQLIKCSNLNEDSEVSEIECLSGHDVLTTLTSHNPSKKKRYSDVNLDLDEPCDSSFAEINYSGLNYFKITESFLKKRRVRKLKLVHLVIPPSFQTDKYPNWKDSANESFISVGADNESQADIIDQMVLALKEANPKESRGKLYLLARALYFHNRKKHRQLVKRRQTRIKTVDKTLDSSLQVIREYVNNKPKKSSKHLNENPKNDKNDIFNGSVSLNISPFKPLPPTIDLVSEDEVVSSNETLENTTFKRKLLPKCEIPAKWTREMTKFYTKPSKRKMKMDLNDIFEDLKRNSSADDWRMDPRDEIGIYQRTPQKGKHKNRRCPNCSQRGHLMHECPSPRKIPTCFLCGLNYHQACSCPNKICHKCGIALTSDAYECTTCYYNSFSYEIPCEVCGKVTHRTEICPDLWRSFHATVDGDKKIPENVKENKRKYCCNCASKGHFSHQCPYPSCEGDHISSFVTNYSASQFENGTTNIVIPHHLSHIIENAEADKFFQKLSNSTNAVIDVEESQTNFTFRVSGTFNQCRQVRDEIEEFVNTRKRKRQEPYPRKKRRKFF